MRKNYHFRRIPDYIEQELNRIQSRHVVVAAIIDTSKEEIAKGAFRHMGIKMTETGIEHPDIISPDKLKGIYARRNRNGIVWILKDLPKITKTIWWESPNFGDPDKGYHSNYRDIKVYQRRFEPPREWEIGITIISDTDKKTRFKAEINTVLDKQNEDFRKDLFFAINLLQEQFRDCHVFDAEMTDEDIAKVTVVGWEIFPPGTMDRTMAEITKRLRNQAPTRQREIHNRVETLNNLHPTEYIFGKGMNSHYFGARFGDNIVVFENIDYGNALYILFDNWQEISQMSRIDILKRHEQDFIRIIHKKRWEDTLKHYLHELRDRDNKK